MRKSKREALERQKPKWWGPQIDPSYGDGSGGVLYIEATPVRFVLDENARMKYWGEKFTRGASIWKKLNEES